MDRGERLEGAQFLDMHASWLADAAQIIADQIGNHDVFRAILGAAEKLLHQASLLIRRGASWAGSLDRAARGPASVQRQKPLGRCTDHTNPPGVEIGRERRRIVPRQIEEEIDRIAFERALDPVREVDLVNIP